MASLQQDFVTYQGDSPRPIFTVRDSAGTALDISSLAEITWTASLEEGSTALITKTMTGGGINLLSGGTTGRFQVIIGSSETTPLSGYYMHRAAITDSTVDANVTTVTVGRMQVGIVPTWTYNPAELATNSVYQVRRLIGDTLYGDQQMQDQEIQWYVNTSSNVWMAASNAARALAAQFARLVDTVQGDLHTLYSQRSKNYMNMAEQYLQLSKGRGVSSGYVYAGGISIDDKQAQVEDGDRVPPQFNIMMFDNLLPTNPVGHQVPGSPTTDTETLP